MSTHLIVLAAGQGKRMMSPLPKVAHEVAGLALVEWVLRSAESLEAETAVVVVGHGAEVVEKALPQNVVIAVQEEQNGTGHATQVGLAAFSGVADDDDVVTVLYGDTPLLTPELVQRLAGLGEDESARLITTRLDDPTGYGRVLRDANGEVVGVVEDRDCSAEQAKISEVNAGLYAVRHGLLVSALDRVTNENAQQEFYLTDVVGILADDGHRLTAVVAEPEEVAGINTQSQLSDAGRELRRRVNDRLMESGVWILDPERTYVDETVDVAPGARLYPGVHLEGACRVEAGATIGPDVYAVDATIGSGARVWYSVLREAQVGNNCEVGPFASLRPGTVMEDGSKIGTFVETKNTHMGEGAKANHLAYLGDAEIGERSNIGAGTVTVNYDGVDKHKTNVGEDAFIGSDTMLVAPVNIGDRASTGAGSVITKDVADDALALERSDQREIPGYSQRRQARKAAKEAED